MTVQWDVQGHRGARALYPENTLEGFAATIARGVPALELDVVLTADRIPVICHDPALDPDLTRGPDGHWLTPPGPAIERMTLAELSGYDVGRARPGGVTASRFPRQSPADGARIPTLAEVCALRPAVRLEVELKSSPGGGPAMARIVAATLDAAGAASRAAIRSFDWSGLVWLRAHRPDLPLVWLTDADAPPSIANDIIAAYAAGPAVPWRPVWAPDHTALTQAAIADAHRRGLRVIPWTVNDPADMGRLKHWGVDGICTDRPDIALSLTEGSPNPSP